MMTEVSGTRTMPGEGRAHAHQRVGAHAAGVIGQQVVGHASHRAAHHRADEQAGTENAAGVAGGVAGGGGDQLQHHQQRHGLDDHLAVERLAHEAVAHAQHVGEEPAQDADRQPAHRRLPPLAWISAGSENVCAATAAV